MIHWLWVVVVIEATALASWIAAAATRQTKLAFVFGFNLMAPVAGVNLAASGEFGWRAAAAAVRVVVYLIDMNVVILLWTTNTALHKLDRVLRPLERHALPLVMANGVGWFYCLRPPRVCQLGAVRRQSVGLAVAGGELRAVRLRRHPEKRSLGCRAIWSGMVGLCRPNKSVLPMGAAVPAADRRRIVERSIIQ